MLQPAKQMTQYVNGDNGHHRGVMVAFTGDNGTFHLGFALCCKKDTFNKKQGRKIAIGRAYKWHEGDKRNIPDSIAEALLSFTDKAERILEQKRPTWMVAL